MNPIIGGQEERPNTCIAVGPDGKFAYGLNTQTNDVTVVDAQTAQVVDIIPADGYQLMPMSDGSILSVVGSSSIFFIDTGTNKKIEFGPNMDHLQLPGELNTFAFSPSGTRAFALANKGVLCLDTSTAKVLARLTDFKAPVQILFENQKKAEEGASGQPPRGTPPEPAMREAPQTQQAPEQTQPDAGPNGGQGRGGKTGDSVDLPSSSGCVAARHFILCKHSEFGRADAYEIEGQLGHRSQRCLQPYTNPPENTAAKCDELGYRPSTVVSCHHFLEKQS